MLLENSYEHRRLGTRLDSNLDKRVKELIRLSLGSSEMRVSFVLVLLRGGLFREAVNQSLPLIGTKHAAWFLYARAWKHLADGLVQEAHKLLAESFRLLGREGVASRTPGFAFSEHGQPKLHVPFNAPFREDTEPTTSSYEETDLLSFPTAMFHEDWLALLSDINHNIREYKLLFRDVARCLDKVLHHDLETVGAAVGAVDLDESSLSGGSSFLLMALMSTQHLRMTGDTLWRICADWGYPVDLCGITAFLHYLLEDDEVALQLAGKGLAQAEDSLLCGNVRALALNRDGKVYLADEQWRKTLEFTQNRCATYLVLGHQALCAGGIDPALRYFQEAVALGDNPAEADRFLSAALDCLED
jgi:hypothetical protein